MMLWVFSGINRGIQEWPGSFLSHIPAMRHVQGIALRTSRFLFLDVVRGIGYSYKVGYFGGCYYGAGA